ncbi:hypothetical protein [Microbispora sp. NPDC046933]|uniref:hypothetical protein n=1 Tax=Microbispora sp. NPDC046933 TaxID=3155618 RepID=UPI0033D82938
MNKPVEKPDWAAPGSPTHQAYSRFLVDNPQLCTVIQQRVASYWACYHRWEFPRLADYPGHRLITAMRAVAGTFTTHRGGRRDGPPICVAEGFPVAHKS